MRKAILFIGIVIFLFNLSILFAGDKNIPDNNTIMYVKYKSIWAYENEKDLENLPKNAKGKYLSLGNKVTVTNHKTIKDKVYIQFQLPDKSKYWQALDCFVLKFITVIQNDLPSFTQPDSDYKGKIKLQQSHFGYFLKEQNGFINVDFQYLVARNADEKTLWAGDLWINSGYTDDLTVAKQAYYLEEAYNLVYGKSPNISEALKKVEEASSVADDETPLTNQIKDLKAELESKVNK